MAEKQQLYIELDPEIAAVFNQSKAVSASHGTSVNLMKATAKRRRSKKQIAEEKEEEERRQREIDQKLARFEEMEQAAKKVMDHEASAKEVKDMIQNLRNSGLIKADVEGNLYPVDDFEEAQALKRQRYEDERTAERMQ